MMTQYDSLALNNEALERRLTKEKQKTVKLVSVIHTGIPNTNFWDKVRI